MGPNSSQGRPLSLHQAEKPCKHLISQQASLLPHSCHTASGIGQLVKHFLVESTSSVDVIKPGKASRRPGSQIVPARRSFSAISSWQQRPGQILLDKTWGTIQKSASKLWRWKPFPTKEFCTWRRRVSAPGTDTTDSAGQPMS